METVNGEWIMLGCREDDPDRLHTTEDLIKLIHRIGFIPLFSNSIPGFSVEERTLSEDWWTDDIKRDPWAWRQILSRDPDIAYGKFFDKKAGFISKEWFPVFANYRRNGYDFDALCDDGLVPYRNKKLMEAFELDDKLCGLELLSFEAKQKAGFGKDGQKNFEGVLTELQMQTYLIMSDFRHKKNKKGEEYGWHIAALETPETKWGYDFISSGYKDKPADSWGKITIQVKSFYPEADDKAIRKLLGIRYPGETVPEKNPKKKQKQEKKTKTNQLPYPDGLFVTLGVDLPTDGDQIEGMQFILENLKNREREIIIMRYKEHMTYQAIADRYGVSFERIRAIHQRAIQKLKKPENACYYQNGYIKTLLQLQEEKEQNAKIIMRKIADAKEGYGTADIIKISIYDMNMTTRTTNCLKRAELYTIEDILVFMADDPSKLHTIRNLGRVSYDELVRRLEYYGIKVKRIKR